MKTNIMVCAALISAAFQINASEPSSGPFIYGYQGSDVQEDWGVIEGLEFDEKSELYPDVLPDYIKDLYTEDNKISFDIRWTFASVYSMYTDEWLAYPNTDTVHGRQEALYDINNNVACKAEFEATDATDYTTEEVDGKVANLELESCLNDGELKNYRMRSYIPTVPGATYAFEFKYRQVKPVEDVSDNRGTCQQYQPYYSPYGYGRYTNLYNFFSGLNRHWYSHNWQKPWCHIGAQSTSTTINDSVLTGKVDFSGYGRDFYRLNKDNLTVMADGFVWPGSSYLDWGFVNRSYAGLGVRSRASNGFYLANEVDYRFAGQIGVSEKLIFTLQESFSYQAEIEFSKFYSNENETGVAEFYRNGSLVSSQVFASNSAGGQYTKLFEVIENGFDKIVIKAADNGTPYWRQDNSDLTVKAITFSDKPIEEPSLFVNIGWDLYYLSTENQPEEQLEQEFKTETIFVTAGKFYTPLTIHKSGVSGSNEVLLRSIEVSEFASNPRQEQCEEIFPDKGDAQAYCLTGEEDPSLYGCDLSQAVIVWKEGDSDFEHSDPSRSTQENIYSQSSDSFLSLGQAGSVSVRMREQGYRASCPIFGKTLSFNEADSTPYNEAGLVRVVLTRCENEALNSGYTLLTNDLDEGAKIFNSEQTFSHTFGEGFEGCAVSHIKLQDAMNVYWSGAILPYDGDGVDINGLSLK
ncbi:hypothetical protein [Vibrio sp. 10N.261.55.A7]|uniref:hypothetical protein n=1 Tax=Vibrio TaxID=662 RepID=UPI000C8592DF|nr:hypothetical protein [Vibrio sp. 10N.261.55.A7]PMK02566.1 hypothetical protein BCU12_18275 [Vibrio sp. 10N.261.55.A7]